ncbi:NUDIX domain-containing protein [Sphingomicrobium sp. XHP0235]|uniref:NUDIX domain-containing protein n=1 Tax=Sphingomicrobium aquimarinum TaxID=3133971 RepID=UPI0031FEBBD7
MKPAIPAATLLLVRDNARGRAETLMVKRTSTMAFAANAWVWPGGRIDVADTLPEGPPPDTVAGVREMLEEVGLAVGLDPLPDKDLAYRLQAELLSGASLRDLLDRHRLAFVPNALRRFARWAPELDLKRRFDTWFLLAHAPDRDSDLSLQESEVAEARWVEPATLLDEIAAGEAHAIFPTLRTLERLAQAGSTDAIFADAAAHPPTKIIPWIEEIDGEEMIRIPEGLGYPVTSVPTREAFRGER